jgi:hypothetical protein
MKTAMTCCSPDNLEVDFNLLFSSMFLIVTWRSACALQKLTEMLVKTEVDHGIPQGQLPTYDGIAH